MTITYAFLCGNERKATEYAAQLAKYGRSVCILPYPDDADEALSQIKTYLFSADEKDKYVLREVSDLFVADHWERGLETVSGKDIQGERVYNVSRLDVYTQDQTGVLQKHCYMAKIEGHVDLRLRREGADINWWDDIFVAIRSASSYKKERDLWGKTSARQQTIGLFICDHVLFKRLKDVSFNSHQPAQAVDFGPEYSASQVLCNNPFVQMAKLDQSAWGLGNLLAHAINEGIFFRSADSRRSGNYFCPPISGIPRIEKADPFWETTFQIHDFFHQVLPEQLFTGEHSPEHKNVYVAARLMSEALTIVMADMLFVEEVKGSGFVYDYSTRKINPLFSSLFLPVCDRGDRSGTTASSVSDKKVQLKALLKANVAFANLGDESLYRAMLKPGGEAAFDAYAETYTHFFVPDLIWSAENFDDMLGRKEQFDAWIQLLGRDLFAQARLPLLDDLVMALKASGADLSSYTSAVWPVFEYLFNQVIAPKLNAPEPVSDEQKQSNAFLRYMIGQSFMYIKYKHVPGMQERGELMIKQLRQRQVFGQQDILRLRNRFSEDLSALRSVDIITPDDCLMYAQIFPLFSPHFLSYDFDKTVYRSISEAIVAAF